MSQTIPSAPRPIVIQVDRSKQPPLPEGVRLLHRQSQKLPQVYNLRGVELWRTAPQVEGRSVTGDFILRHLEQSHLLKRCLDLVDGEAIIAKGGEAFREAFGDQPQNVLLFGSAVTGINGQDLQEVPGLAASGGRLTLGWFHLSHALSEVCPVALFPPLEHSK